MSQWVLDRVIIIIVSVLGTIIVTTYLVLLIGLFVQSVDNKDIFAVITPTLNSTVGGFIGILSALKVVEARDRQTAQNGIGPAQAAPSHEPPLQQPPMGA